MQKTLIKNGRIILNNRFQVHAEQEDRRIASNSIHLCHETIQKEQSIFDLK